MFLLSSEKFRHNYCFNLSALETTTKNSKEIIEFLKTVSPFQDLDETTLRRLADSVTEESYPKGFTILHQDGPASEHLRVITKGAVKIFVSSGQDETMAIDTRGEGECFGFLSLVSGDKSRANVMAVEDTSCYLVGRDAILRLLDLYPAFSEYFLKSFLVKYVDKTYHEMRNKTLCYGGGDRLLFTTPVGELATKQVITASQEIAIKEAAGVMSRHRISSLVLVDPDGVPTGIVTDRDLRDKVIARGRNVEEAIRNIMSVSLIKSEARDYCFEALLKMIRYNVHHLLIIDNGVLKGVITNHDLMMLQGTSPLSIVREIESQNSVEGLVSVSRKSNKIIELLIKEGAKASNITRIITEINDRLEKKALEITENKLGRPPLPYCWIVYGSEGRKEQTFRTDQDNAIIHDDPNTAEEEAAATAYFTEFAAFANNVLVNCGFPACTGGYMASNPQWRRPLKAWKEYFSEWIITPTPEAILKSVILFDFRPVHGDFSLAERLKSHLAQTLKKQDMFLSFMADMTLKLRPPLGFFKNIIVEKSGEHKDELNLKFKCIAPLINIIRLYSLEKGISETSTLERLEALRNSHSAVREFGDELEHAFEFLSLLRIHHQYRRIQAGLEPDNFINPGKLGNLEKKTLKESCRLILRMQDSITRQYKPGMGL